MLWKKLRPEAKDITKAHPDDAGIDLYAAHIEKGDWLLKVYTGIAVEIPSGHVGLLFPRSSISNYSLIMANSVGVIDSGYDGEIIAKFIITGNEVYNIGDKVAQLVIVRLSDIVPVRAEEIAKGSRGSSGFGSSGL